MKEIDIWEIASEIEKENVPEARAEIEEFIDSVKGQSFHNDEIITKLIGPLMGISSAANKKFTIDLIERVVDELNKDE